MRNNTSHNYKMKNLLLYLIVLWSLSSCTNNKDVNINIAVTTDVHGMIFGMDPAMNTQNPSSMSKISGKLKEYDDNLLLLDNGDNLQGSPSVYYYNFENTSIKHLWPRITNYMGYDAISVGNHDFEAGHSVYDRIKGEYNASLLAANAINIESGEPYFEPYIILKKGGIKIAVLGLVTPGVPGWIPEILYRGIEFEDMVESAAKWMPEIQAQNPDLIIGLFHSGWNDSYGGGEPGSYKNENASLSVAREVAGFDIIFIGHDHDLMSDYIETNSGDSVLIMDSGSHARYFSFVNISGSRGDLASGDLKVDARIIKADTLSPDPDFDKEFQKDYDLVSNYINRKLAYLENDLSTRESYFGDSDFMDLIHTIQLENSGADLSFAAPLSFDVNIPSGDIRVSDMFDLYRFENMLYTIKLSGAEIDSYLEYSVDLWFNTLDKNSKEILKYTKPGSYSLLNRYYNFDSAAGIDYLVDLSKPAGAKVDISSFSNKTVFSLDSTYLVALNSYRATGGGGHLERGCGLLKEDISLRMVKSTEKDLRYYMMKWFEKQDTVSVKMDGNWRIEPAKYIQKLEDSELENLFKQRDY